MHPFSQRMLILVYGDLCMSATITVVRKFHTEDIHHLSTIKLRLSIFCTLNPSAAVDVLIVIVPGPSALIVVPKLQVT